MIAAMSPVHECLIPGTLFELGLGNIVIAKKVSIDAIGVGVFLLDIYCLGVKNAFFTIVEHHEYSRLLQRIESEGPLETIHPSCARKLIEGGVTYAEQLGFKPHKDYKTAGKIFGNIDVKDCPRTFEYGYEGKPLYVSGPHDTPQRSEWIIKTLSEHCGQGGFDFMSRIDDF